MTNFIQKFLLLIPFITFTNTLFAQKWPYFSTEKMKEDYIELNTPFKKSSNITDSKYLYYLKNSSKFNKEIHKQIKNDKSSILLVPDVEKSSQKKVKYFIFINDYMTGTTNIHRKKNKH